MGTDCGAAGGDRTGDGAGIGGHGAAGIGSSSETTHDRVEIVPQIPVIARLYRGASVELANVLRTRAMAGTTSGRPRFDDGDWDDTLELAGQGGFDNLPPDV